jgi:capsular polysaccharide biosynthesis protein
VATGFIKRWFRPLLLSAGRKFIGSTRRGPVQEVTCAADWVRRHPAEADMLWTGADWKLTPPPSLTQQAFAHPAFSPPVSPNKFGGFVAEIRHAFVTGSSVAVITPDRRLVGEVSIEFGHSPENHGAMRRLFFRKPPERLSGKWGLLAVTGGDGFYHHLLEVVPRHEMIRMAGIRPDRLDGWIVNDTRHPFQRESWEALGLTGRQIRTTARRAYYQCDSLVIPSLPTHPGETTPWSVDYLRRLFGVQSSARGSRRLYIRREGVGTRRILDEAPLLKLLRKYNFEVVQPEKMTVADQARLFSQAAIVAGPHGAGMSNLVFAPPHSLCIEFFHPRYVNACYWWLCAAAGVRYAHVIGSGDQKSAPKGDATGHIRLGAVALEHLHKILAGEGIPPR